MSLAVLIIAPHSAAEPLTRVLSEQKISHLAVEAIADASPTPSVVIMTEMSDAELVISETRSKFGQEVKVIYLADQVGSRRTALQVTDLRVDVFLQRPLSSVALLYALGETVVSSNKMNSMVESAIDEFVADAMDSLAEIGGDVELGVDAVPTPITKEESSDAHTVVLAPKPGGVMSQAASELGDDIDSSEGGSSLGASVRQQMSKIASTMFPHKTPEVGARVDHRADIDLGAVEAASISDVGAKDSIAGLPRTGAIVRGKSDVPSLLSHVANAGVTCQILFSRDDVKKVIYCDAGVPDFAMSSLPHDRLGDLLYREGRITQEQHAQSRRISLEQSKRLGEVLVEHGLIDASELEPAIKRHVEEIIYSIFSWSRGRYEMEDTKRERNESVVLNKHPYAIVLEGIARKVNADDAAGHIGSDDFVLAIRAPERLAKLLEKASLNQGERRFLESIDKGLPFSDIVARSGVSRSTGLKLSYTVLVLGVANLREVEGLDDEQILDIEEQEILNKMSHVEEADYFTVLGVDAAATPDEITAAYERNKRRYANGQFHASIQDRYGEEISEIQEVLTEAYSVLADERLRLQYTTAFSD